MAGGATAWPATTLLSRVGAQAREALTTAGTWVRFGPQKTILRQGDHSQHALLLLGGFVKILAVAESGYEALLEIRVGGDLIGEMAAADGQPRSATVVTCGTVPARVIGHAELEEISRRHPEIPAQLLRSISERLRWANRRRIDFRGYDAPTRVSRILVELADLHGRLVDGRWELDVRLTQSELASLAGVALPTVEKALSTLDGEGLIDRVRRGVAITDLPRLRAACRPSGI